MTVIIVVIAPTTGNIFPAIPPSGPSAVLARFPSGPRTVLTAFPSGAISVVALLKAPVIPLVIRPPIFPSGLFAIAVPTVPSIGPSLPPTSENGLSKSPSSFVPAPVSAPPAFVASPMKPLTTDAFTLPMKPVTAPITLFPLKILPIAEPTPPKAPLTLPK